MLCLAPYSHGCFRKRSEGLAKFSLFFLGTQFLNVYSSGSEVFVAHKAGHLPGVPTGPSSMKCSKVMSKPMRMHSLPIAYSRSLGVFLAKLIAPLSGEAHNFLVLTECGGVCVEFFREVVRQVSEVLFASLPYNADSFGGNVLLSDSLACRVSLGYRLFDELDCAIWPIHLYLFGVANQPTSISGYCGDSKASSEHELEEEIVLWISPREFFNLGDIIVA